MMQISCTPVTQYLACAAHGGLVLCASIIVIGCVSVRIEPLTDKSYAPRAGGNPVQWLDAEPDAPFVKLARIAATSDSVDEDRLREKILDRAAPLGADAVVMGKFDIFESMGPSPLYESTIGWAGDSGNPYTGGWGWGSPFYYDPWTFVQSASDQVDRTEYLSGIAIRYVNEE